MQCIDTSYIIYRLIIDRYIYFLYTYESLYVHMRDSLEFYSNDTERP